MKTRLFFGAPPARDCLKFENVEALQKWLDEKARLRNGALMVDKLHNLPSRKRCACLQLGADGNRGCYPPMMPHRNRIRLPEPSTMSYKELVCCDNHLQNYLNSGWTLMEKLCQFCCLAKATLEDSCEGCLEKMTVPASEAQRLKKQESGFCVNRDNVQGCCTYSEPDSQYCPFCRNHNLMLPADREDTAMGKRQEPRPKVRTILSSTRPCRLTASCVGQMTAAVSIHYANAGPQLWWNCPVCRANVRAARTWSIPAADDPASLDAVYGPADALNPDLSEHVAHVKATILESESE